MLRPLATLAGATLACAAPALLTTPAAQAAKLPGAVAEAQDLVAGPHVTAAGAVVWIERTKAGWRLRTTQVGGKPTTIAQETLKNLEDYDGGNISSAWLGSVAFGGDRVLIERRSRAGSAKYSQYINASRVTVYALNADVANEAEVASCSVHEDGFGGPKPGQEPAPSATLLTGDGASAVHLCGTTRLFGADPTAPAATVDAAAPPSAIAGDLVAAFRSDGVPHLAVTRWPSGTPVYDLPVADPGTHAFGLALQADGAAAVVTHPTKDGTGCDGTLTWHTPGAPTGATLATDVCGTAPALTGGQVVVATQPAGAPGRTLTLVRTDASRLPLAWLGTVAAPTFGPAGERSVYAVEGCDGAWTIARAAGDASPRPLACSGLALTQAKRVGRILSVRVKLDPAATGPVRLTFRAGGRTATKTLTPTAGRATTRWRLPRWAMGAKGRTSATYAGDATFVRRVVTR